MSTHACTLSHEGDTIVLSPLGDDAKLHIAHARVFRAELPLNGSFRLQGQLVRLAPLGQRLHDNETLPGLVGQAPCMRDMAELVRRLSRLDRPVTIRGGSGSGKELVARAIHTLSPRAEEPFVALNAATLSDALGRSALFGHARGAFTGASQSRDGAFCSAHGGTLFIDEIASLNLDLQAALLRVVESQLVMPVGVDVPRRVNVRLVVATCEPLKRMVERGLFRRDLFERLSTYMVRVPALNQRRGDIPAIARRLLVELGSADMRLTEAANEVLAALDYSGNVRELRNLLAQATLYTSSEQLVAADIYRALHDRAGSEWRNQVSADHMQAIVAAEGGNISAAARRAGMARSTFRDLLRVAERVPPRRSLSAALRAEPTS